MILSPRRLSLRSVVGACAFLIVIPVDAESPPSEPIAQRGELLFSDNFERDELGEWKSIIPTFSVSGGVLKGEQTREDHGSVGRVYRPMKNVVVEFKFMLDGSPTFNAVFDDQGYKGSHAGHICRVAFASTQTRLGDDKEGVMRNDIYEMRKDPARKAEAEKLLMGRGSASSVKLIQKKWYLAVIEIIGDRMRVSVDGKAVGYLQSPGLAHEIKTSFHFTVSGPGVLFDDVHIWKAK